MNAKPIREMAGYQLVATSLGGEPITSYAEAADSIAGLRRCLAEFPREEGYREHYVEDVETRVMTNHTVLFSSKALPMEED